MPLRSQGGHHVSVERIDGKPTRSLRIVRERGLSRPRLSDNGAAQPYCSSPTHERVVPAMGTTLARRNHR
jgi:hypothetical protein